MWPLVGVLVLAAGFRLRLNPLASVMAAAFAAGLASGHGPLDILAHFGKAFNEARYVSLIWLVTPVIGLLERAGLRQAARRLIAGAKGLTPGRLLFSYLGLRQISAALGLTALGGQAQMVRPLIAPMTEQAGETLKGEALSEDETQALRAHAAATDNIGVFFGEDIFIAFGSVLLIRGVLAAGGHDVGPFAISVYAIPTAVLAFLAHGFRLLRLDRRFRKTQP